MGQMTLDFCVQYINSKLLILSPTEDKRVVKLNFYKKLSTLKIGMFVTKYIYFNISLIQLIIFYRFMPERPHGKMYYQSIRSSRSHNVIHLCVRHPYEKSRGFGYNPFNRLTIRVIEKFNGRLSHSFRIHDKSSSINFDNLFITNRDDSILCFQNGICVSNNHKLKKENLSKAHRSKYTVHPINTKM